MLTIDAIILKLELVNMSSSNLQRVYYLNIKIKPLQKNRGLDLFY